MIPFFNNATIKLYSYNECDEDFFGEKHEEQPFFTRRSQKTLLFPENRNLVFFRLSLIRPLRLFQPEKAIRSAKSGTHSLEKRRKRRLNVQSKSQISGVKTFIFSVACSLSAACKNALPRKKERRCRYKRLIFFYVAEQDFFKIFA